MLQTKFEKVQFGWMPGLSCPRGSNGCWQTALRFFLGMSIPSSTKAISEGEGAKDKYPEYMLARAWRHIQLGDLENAVHELEMLEGRTGLCHY